MLICELVLAPSAVISVGPAGSAGPGCAFAHSPSSWTLVTFWQDHFSGKMISVRPFFGQSTRSGSEKRGLPRAAARRREKRPKEADPEIQLRMPEQCPVFPHARLRSKRQTEGSEWACLRTRV